jgi:hypothetical protein
MAHFDLSQIAKAFQSERDLKEKPDPGDFFFREKMRLSKAAFSSEKGNSGARRTATWRALSSLYDLPDTSPAFLLQSSKSRPCNRDKRGSKNLICMLPSLWNKSSSFS